MNPTRSPNSTVVIRRSETGGATALGRLRASISVPHWMQNRPVGAGAAQLGQARTATDCPQSWQNRAPAASSAPH